MALKPFILRTTSEATVPAGSRVRNAARAVSENVRQQVGRRPTIPGDSLESGGRLQRCSAPTTRSRPSVCCCGPTRGRLDALTTSSRARTWCAPLLGAAHPRRRGGGDPQPPSSTEIDGEGDGLVLAIQPRDGDTIVGDIVLMYRSETHRQGEIGFVLHPDHQGHGYATEAARAMLRLGFEQLDLHRIDRPPARRATPPRRGDGAAGHASRGAPARERVGEGRVAERAGLRDAGAEWASLR